MICDRVRCIYWRRFTLKYRHSLWVSAGPLKIDEALSAERAGLNLRRRSCFGQYGFYWLWFDCVRLGIFFIYAADRQA